MKTELDRRDFTKVCSASTLSALTCGLSDTLTAAAAEPPSAKPSYDCIVLGLGAMGSACVYQLAKRGASVLGLEQFDIAHVLGSSGGISRQTKVMPYLGGRYEPLIRRANENWRTLEKDSKQQVFHQCGYLQLGANQRLPRGEGTKIELLDESALATRFPQFQELPRGTNGILDHQGGLLRSELAIASHCHVALRHGAHIRAQEPVTDWSTDGDGVSVTTKRGKYRAKHLVIAAGAWNAKLVPQLRGKLQVTRLSLGWFAPKDPSVFLGGKVPDLAARRTLRVPGAAGLPRLQSSQALAAVHRWIRIRSTERRMLLTRNSCVTTSAPTFPQRMVRVLAFKVCMYTHGGPWLGPLPGEKSG